MSTMLVDDGKMITDYIKNPDCDWCKDDWPAHHSHDGKGGFCHLDLLATQEAGYIWPCPSKIPPGYFGDEEEKEV